MSNPSLGAMLHYLDYLGGGSERNASEFYGRKIVAATLDEDADPNRLRLEFEDGSKISVWDNGQSCCEQRYTTCDDDLGALVGGVLRKIEVKEMTEEGDDQIHETAFLEIATDSASITAATHNQHNGYYGGFGLTITEDA